MGVGGKSWVKSQDAGWNSGPAIYVTLGTSLCVAGLLYAQLQKCVSWINTPAASILFLFVRSQVVKRNHYEKGLHSSQTREGFCGWRGGRGVDPTPQRPRDTQGICSGHQCALEHSLKRDDQRVLKDILLANLLCLLSP